MIAHLSFSAKYYGRESAAFSLVKALQSKIDVIMLLVIESRPGLEEDNRLLVEKIKDFGIRHEIVNTEGRFSKVTMKLLQELIRQHDIRLVHCHCFKSVIYSLLINLIYKSNVKIVFTLHGLILPFNLKSIVYKAINLLAVALSDGVIGCTTKYLPTITALPWIKNKTTVIVNAYEQNSSSQISRHDARQLINSHCDGIPEDRLIVAFIGRFTAVKNPMLFLDIASRVKEVFTGSAMPVHFVMIGEGELKADIKSHIEMHDLAEYVTLTGYVADMTGLYPAIDILLMTSDIEGIPMCILEAMSYSIPVLAPDVGGIPEIIRNAETGLLFPRRNAQECTRLLVNLIKSSNLLRDIGTSGNRYLKDKFSYARSINSHLDFYNRILPDNAKLTTFT